MTNQYFIRTKEELKKFNQETWWGEDAVHHILHNSKSYARQDVGSDGEEEYEIKWKDEEYALLATDMDGYFEFRVLEQHEYRRYLEDYVHYLELEKDWLEHKTIEISSQLKWETEPHFDVK